MSHEPRLARALRSLLQQQRVAALGTSEADGHVFVSMVPFAVDPQQASIVIHVSRLAAHTGNLLHTPQVSLLIMQAEREEAPVHDLPRVTFQGVAALLEPDSAVWLSARTAYLARFPQAQPMTQLGDFGFVGITVRAARHVAGFGAARAVDEDEWLRLLSDK